MTCDFSPDELARLHFMTVFFISSTSAGVDNPANPADEAIETKLAKLQQEAAKGVA